MNGQLTVKDLFEFCIEQMRAGNGEKYIVVSTDNEGNSFHGLFYGFSNWDDYYKNLIVDSNANSAKDTIILG